MGSFEPNAWGTEMTRINIIPPEELADQHLMAEYREIFMVGSSLQRSMKSKSWVKTLANIPHLYTLNKGHVTFFYDKGMYLQKRYLELTRELRLRGFNLDEGRLFKLEQWPASLFNDWKPSVTEQNIARARIAFRISERPNWYRWTEKK